MLSNFWLFVAMLHFHNNVGSRAFKSCVRKSTVRTRASSYRCDNNNARFNIACACPLRVIAEGFIIINILYDPFGILKRFKILNAVCRASSSLLPTKAVWLKNVARTKRDGGVKSPGNPSMPEPWPKDVNVTLLVVVFFLLIGLR